MFATISAVYVLTLLVTLIISITLHEAMHAWTARYLGDTTADEAGRITLNPLRHVDIWFTILIPLAMLLFGLPPILAAKPVPFDPRNVRYGEAGAALVGAAGPLTNLVLAVLASLVIRFGGLPTGYGFGYVVSLFMTVNIALFVFNMIPFPPLDGSRVLYAVAPDPLRRIMEQVEALGFGVTLMILLVLSHFIGPFVLNLTNGIYDFLLR